MKVCPDCKSTFDDDVEVCPNDDVELVDAPDALPENPVLREVVEVSPSERTSMIDLEAIEAKRQERAAEEAPADPEATPPPASAPADPDATGSIDVEAYRRRKRAKRGRAARADAEAADEAGVEAGDGDAPREATRTKRERSGRGSVKPERTSQSKRGGGSRVAPEPEDRTAVVAADDEELAVRRGALSPLLAAAGVLLLLVALGTGVYFVARSSAVLTVTSVPPGAIVKLDGKAIGDAPVQKRVALGNHTIELELAGYEPFKEVVDVPVEGVAFLQPLRQTPAEPAPPTAAQIADETAAAAPRLVQQGDLDGAFERIKDLIKADDPRADALMKQIAAARKVAAVRAEKDRKDQGARAARGKKAEARVAHQEGEQLYGQDRLEQAKEKLLEAIRLDPAYAAPHRAIARIFVREGATSKARYHLGRFLALGGADPDFKVREWLKQHPAP